MFIGSNTKNGRPLPASATCNCLCKGPQVVIMVEGVMVRKTHRITVVRFSKVAAAQFADTNTTDLTLNIHDSRFMVQPSKDAISFVLDWMEVASSTPRSGILPNCTVPNPDEADLVWLCDIYAALLAFDVRPHRATFQACEHLKDFVSKAPPSLATIETVRMRLPLEDVVTTRMITSFYQHGEKYQYSDAEVEEMKYSVQYCEDGGQLFARFGDIETDREARARARSHARKSKQQGRGGQRGGSASGGGRVGVAGGDANGGAKNGAVMGAAQEMGNSTMGNGAKEHGATDGVEMGSAEVGVMESDVAGMTEELEADKKAVEVAMAEGAL